MSPWDTAGAAIDAAFADPEPIIYTGAGLLAQPLPAIRTDNAAPSFDGPGSTLRAVVYEVRQADLPAEPRKPDSFTHRGRIWHVQDVTRRDDIGKWELVVNKGAAA